MQRYQTHSIASIDEVLDLINAHSKSTGVINGVRVKLRSLRLRTFALYGIQCSNCYIDGTYFAIQRTVGAKSYHLNLWSKNEQGADILMTHDHTLSRGMGGSNTIDNTTTMCYHCNQAKSLTERPPHH